MSVPRCVSRPCRHLLLVLSALGAALVAGGCRSTPATPATTVSSDTWAVVDGREIRRDDVERALRRVRTDADPMSDDETLAARLTVLNDLITEDILLARARRLNIEASDGEVDKAYVEAKQNIPDDAFQKELAQRSLTVADVRERLRRELVIQRLMEREIGAKVNVTDQQVTDFFNANRAQFNLAEDVYQLAQIVITPVREAQTTNRTGDDAATPQAASAKVAMLMERLKGGAGFGDLARDYSEDPETAPRGGDLGAVPLSALKQAPPALRNAVLQTAPGSARVVSENGGHTIVFVAAREPAGQRDLSTPGVRENIRETLYGRKEQLLRTAYVTAAQNEANVVNHLARRILESPSDAVRSILSRP